MKNFNKTPVLFPQATAAVSLDSYEDYRINGGLPMYHEYQDVRASLEGKKDYYSKMIGFATEQYLKASYGEGITYSEEQQRYIALFNLYRNHLNRYMNNEFINKYSGFKNLGKKKIEDFSKLPSETDFWDDLPF